MKKCLTIILIASQALATSAQSQGVTVNLLIDGCNSSDPAAQSLCGGYINGTIDGLKWAGDVAAFELGFTEGRAMREQGKILVNACIPDSATGGQLYEVALQFMRSNPQIWHQPAVTVIHQSMMDAFPCE